MLPFVALNLTYAPFSAMTDVRSTVFQDVDNEFVLLDTLNVAEETPAPAIEVTI